jgi:TfoX/Sxy family transcriptional regulator of competence genes
MKAKPVIPKRPKLLRISEEMKQWSVMMEQELSAWPSVKSRPMFGFIGFYRDNKIFAGLPRTRALNTPNSIILKFDPLPPNLLKRAQEDTRIEFEKEAPGARWYSFELNSASDLRDALWWLNQAYLEARNKHSRIAKRRRGPSQHL